MIAGLKSFTRAGSLLAVSVGAILLAACSTPAPGSLREDPDVRALLGPREPVPYTVYLATPTVPDPELPPTPHARKIGISPEDLRRIAEESLETTALFRRVLPPDAVSVQPGPAQRLFRLAGDANADLVLEVILQRLEVRPMGENGLWFPNLLLWLTLYVPSLYVADKSYMVEADLVYRLRNTELGEVVHERRFRARSEVDLDYDDRGIGFFEGLFRFPLLLWSEDDEDRWRAIREKVLPHATYLVKKNLVVDLLTELDPVARERAFGALVHPTGHQSPEVALVVGVSDYRADAYRGRCLFGEKDAIAFRDHLADGAADRFDPGALELLVGKQATLAGIERALLKTFRGTPGRERITLYFSGLGMAESRDGGHRFYLLPRDADPDDLDGTAIPLDEIAAYVRGSVAREVVVIVDAAFGSRGDSKGAPRESAPSPEERAALQRLAEEMGSDGEAGPRLVVLAARAGDAALELTQAGTEHGNLTFALLRALDGGKADRTGEGNDDGLVTVGELKGYLPGAIEREARFENQKQVPLVYGNDETILRQLD